MVKVAYLCNSIHNRLLVITIVWNLRTSNHPCHIPMGGLDNLHNFHNNNVHMRIEVSFFQIYDTPTRNQKLRSTAMDPSIGTVWKGKTLTTTWVNAQDHQTLIKAFFPSSRNLDSHWVALAAWMAVLRKSTAFGQLWQQWRTQQQHWRWHWGTWGLCSSLE